MADIEKFECLECGVEYTINEMLKDLNLRECEVGHSLIYFKGSSCPVCKLQGGYNELRAMYFEEYNRTHSSFS